jgi:hypothetical protein
MRSGEWLVGRSPSIPSYSLRGYRRLKRSERC